LADIINLIILVCELSLDKKNVSNRLVGTAVKTPFWHLQAKLCIKNGSKSELNIEYVNYIAKLFNINNIKISSCQDLLQIIANTLFDKYSKSKFASSISPNMSNPIMIDYNAQSIEFHRQFLEKIIINDIILPEIELNNNYIDVIAEFDELSDLSKEIIPISIQVNNQKKKKNKKKKNKKKNKKQRRR